MKDTAPGRFLQPATIQQRRQGAGAILFERAAESPSRHAALCDVDGIQLAEHLTVLSLGHRKFCAPLRGQLPFAFRVSAAGPEFCAGRPFDFERSGGHSAGTTALRSTRC